MDNNGDIEFVDVKIRNQAGIDIEELVKKANKLIDKYAQKGKSVSGAIFYAVRWIVKREIERLYLGKKDKDYSPIVIIKTGGVTGKNIISLSDILYKAGNRYENAIVPIRNPKDEDINKSALDKIRALIEDFRKKLDSLSVKDKELNKIEEFDISNRETIEKSFKYIAEQVGNYIQDHYEKGSDVSGYGIVKALDDLKKISSNVEISYTELTDKNLEDKSGLIKNISSAVVNFDLGEEVLRALRDVELSDNYERFAQRLTSEFMRHCIYPNYIRQYLFFTEKERKIELDERSLDFVYNSLGSNAQESFWNCFQYSLLKEYSPYVCYDGDRVNISYHLYPRAQIRTPSLKSQLQKLCEDFGKINNDIGYKPLKRLGDYSKTIRSMKGYVESNFYRVVRLIGNLYIYLAILDGKLSVDKFLDLSNRYQTIFRNQDVALGWLLGLTFFNFDYTIPFLKDLKSDLKSTGSFLKSLYLGNLPDDKETLNDKGNIEKVLVSVINLFRERARKQEGGFLLFNNYEEINDEAYKKSIYETLKSVNGVWETQNSISTVIQTYRNEQLKSGGFCKAGDDEYGIRINVLSNLKETKKSQDNGKPKRYSRTVSVKIENTEKSKIMFYLPTRFDKNKESFGVNGKIQLVDTPVRRYLNLSISDFIPKGISDVHERENIRRLAYSLTITLYLLLYALYLAKDEKPLTIFSVYDGDHEQRDESEISDEYIIIKDFVLGYETLTGKRVVETGIKYDNLKNAFAVWSFLRKSILQKPNIIFNNISERVWLMFMCKDFYTVDYSKVKTERYGAFLIGLDPNRGYIPARYIVFKNFDEFVIKLSSFIENDYIVVKSFDYLSEFYELIRELSDSYPNTLISKTSVRYNSDTLKKTGKSIIADRISQSGKHIYHFINPKAMKKKNERGEEKKVKTWKTLSLYQFKDDKEDKKLKDVFAVIMSYINSKSIERESDSVGKVGLFNDLEVNTIRNRYVLSFKVKSGVKSSSITVTIPLAILLAKMRYVLESES